MSGGAVCFVEFAVASEPRAIIFATAANHFGIAKRLAIGLERFGTEGAASTPALQRMLEEIIRVLADERLGERRGLREEVPMIDRARAVPVDALELFDGWNDVQHRRAPHSLRMIEREAIGHAPAAIVPHYIEAFVTQRRHHLGH